jgi:hypothetical protein
MVSSLKGSSLKTYDQPSITCPPPLSYPSGTAVLYILHPPAEFDAQKVQSNGRFSGVSASEF